MDWQEIVALLIVAATAGLLLRSVASRKPARFGDCCEKCAAKNDTMAHQGTVDK